MAHFNFNKKAMQTFFKLQSFSSKDFVKYYNWHECYDFTIAHLPRGKRCRVTNGEYVFHYTFHNHYRFMDHVRYFADENKQPIAIIAHPYCDPSDELAELETAKTFQYNLNSYTSIRTDDPGYILHTKLDFCYANFLKSSYSEAAKVVIITKKESTNEIH